MSRCRRSSSRISAALVAELDDGALGERLSVLLAPDELAAIAMRASDLLRDGHFPIPDAGYHSVPWPMV